MLHNFKIKKLEAVILCAVFVFCLSACGSAETQITSTVSTSVLSETSRKKAEETSTTQAQTLFDETSGNSTESSTVTTEIRTTAGSKTTTVKPDKRIYTDANGDKAYIPEGFTVSAKKDERTINTGLVVIGPDSSEFVWIPTTLTPLKVRDFGSYIFGSSLSGYSDEADLELYKSMVRSTEKYGGFYIGRFEASKGTDGLPQSKRVTPENPGTVWVGLSPQKTADICQKKYPDNNGVQGFFPWGINWDTVLQWLIDSGCKQADEITTDSTSWGNYSNDTFSEGAEGNYTGAWEEAKANNIYDLAGNNWEWTQERHGISYVMRGGGYNMAGGACPGNKYPAALRDPLPGTDFHSNATFRLAIFIK